MLLSVPSTAGAQDGYNPDNPPDPMMRYKVTVSAEPAEAGYYSGGGSYVPGTTVSVSTSVRNSDYKFLYWMQDGVRIDKSSTFSYTMGNEKTSFVAVYGYDPSNPGDPAMINRHRLYLDTNEDGSCTFNLTSGLKQEAGQYVTVRAQNISPGYVFQGWYVGDEKVGSSTTFNYLMPSNDVTLIARFVYDPANPDDPVGVNDPEPLFGDVNGDGGITAQDASLVLQLVANKINAQTEGIVYEAADVNGDGYVTAQDASLILQYVAGKISW
jgi:uncharacterized repeat protein (TIGR02543 family)